MCILIHQYVNDFELKTDYFNDGLRVNCILSLPISMHVPNFCNITTCRVTLVTLRVSRCSSTTTSEPVTFFLKKSTGYCQKKLKWKGNQSRNKNKINLLIQKKKIQKWVHGKHIECDSNQKSWSTLELKRSNIYKCVSILNVIFIAVVF